MDDYGIDNTKSAQFNAAMHFVNRVGLSQANINEANVNPTAYNVSAGVYNYELILRETINLYREVKPKLPYKKIEFAEKMKDLLVNFLSAYPVHIRIDGRPQLAKKRWDIFWGMLDSYQDLIKQYLDDHEVNNPNKREDIGL